MVRNILIVGPPRSGTSLTAAAFARRGYFVGDIAKAHVREGDDGNPFGYYEADALVACNVDVLRAAGFPEHNTWKFGEIGDDAARRIADLLPTDEHRAFVAAYERHAPWVWKDPRLCYTLPYWWKLLDPARAGVVFIRRDLREVCDSFVQRRWCDGSPEARMHVMRRIARHIDAAERAIQQLHIPHLAIEYADVLRAPERIAQQFTGFCGVPFTAAALNVRPELNHSTLRGQLQMQLRRAMRLTWLAPLKGVQRIVPRGLLGVVFPDKRRALGG